MARTARLVVPGIPMHITQRGSRRFDVFQDETDRLDYLKLFRQCCRDYELRVVAYCLMTNHVHFVAIPERAETLHRVFHRLNGAHSQRFNRKYGFEGHLWQERPFSCLLDAAHLVTAVRYVELNPVRAGMVDHACDYRWSSAVAHCSGGEDPWLDVETAPFSIPDWAAWLDGRGDPAADQSIRDCTAKGQPCGDDVFVKQIELAANRDFTRKKPGRKPKSTTEESAPLWTEDRTAL
jgi:REP-associated tyrosine transposase